MWYDPEHWPEELWADDLERMKKCGISLIRLSVRNPEDTCLRRFTELCADKDMQLKYGFPTGRPGNRSFRPGQLCGPLGWGLRPEAPAPRPGQLTLWAMQAIADGAEELCLPRWRTCPEGPESGCRGILDCDNRDNRRLREVTVLSLRLQKLRELAGTQVIPSFALLKDTANARDCRTDRAHRRIMAASMDGIRSASARERLPFETVDPELTDPEALSAYPLLVWPHPAVADEKTVAKLKDCVSRGATLLIGCMSGCKDCSGRRGMLPQPGLLAELTGSDVRDYTFADPREANVTVLAEGTQLEAPLFNDVLSVTGEAEIIGRYTGGGYAGEGALTVHRCGNGRVFHWGSVFSADTAAFLLRRCGAVSPTEKLAEAPSSVVLTLRQKAGRKYLFVLNGSTAPAELTLKGCMTDPVTENPAQGTLTLPPFGTGVFSI